MKKLLILLGLTVFLTACGTPADPETKDETVEETQVETDPETAEETDPETTEETESEEESDAQNDTAELITEIPEEGYVFENDDVKQILKSYELVPNTENSNKQVLLLHLEATNKMDRLLSIMSTAAYKVEFYQDDIWRMAFPFPTSGIPEDKSPELREKVYRSLETEETREYVITYDIEGTNLPIRIIQEGSENGILIEP